MSTLPKWTEEREDTLKNTVGSTQPVTVATVARAAEVLETTTRSVASKLRKMGYEVESSAEVVNKKYTDAEEAQLRKFVESNPNKYTYAEIAEKVLNGTRNARQIQGKLLSMELYGLVKETPKVESARKYSEAEEAKILTMVRKGDFIEDIASALNKEVPQIRGKILSLMRDNEDIKIPKQKTYAKAAADPIEELGDISKTSIEDIAEKIGKTVRGVKTMLTYRSLDCANYSGSKRAEKNARKAG